MQIIMEFIITNANVILMLISMVLLLFLMYSLYKIHRQLCKLSDTVFQVSINKKTPDHEKLFNFEESLEKFRDL